MTVSIPSLLNTAQVAERFNLSASYLNKLRLTGGGPRFVKIGRRVAYDIVDLLEWIEAQKRVSTSECSFLD
ncbi:helix-turn-helix transcriptional regulator [Oceanicaulis alexandrii]|uniref:helix-turn-helix transcriptional regulator n=1 Tax=Oceanicaulis alexandrii TaxID=153233 RepID=UPI003BAE816F